MASDDNSLFSDLGTTASDGGQKFTTGLLPGQILRAMIHAHEISATQDIKEEQIQPASLDLRLGAVAYRIRASFLPGEGATVREKLDQVVMHEIDLSKGAVLETGCVYLCPLMEHLSLGYRVSGSANAKSSTGRLDVFTRLVVDGARAFDTIPQQYTGPLWAEISPRTFSVLVRTGSRLNQLRLRRGSPNVSDFQLRKLQSEVGIVSGEARIEKGVGFSIDLDGDPLSGLVGYRAKRHAGVIDMDRVGACDPQDFWEPVHARKRRAIILDPGEFYILASREAVAIPPEWAAEMVPFDPLVGEFRVHYAGFFDPGFGYSGAGGAGSRAVLEVRSHEVPFVLEHGQTVGRLMFERLIEPPQRLYGQGIGSNYQRQGLALSKHFKRL
ncbi:MAG: 2'-deoxycytidine 5'-triphosphate deaminase [Alphaproteobacteria bacterium]|nr:2'-deoxycytidine 5'-triphosphate deaminase [Alphaproteobacteria bacterium]